MSKISFKKSGDSLTTEEKDKNLEEGSDEVENDVIAHGGSPAEHRHRRSSFLAPFTATKKNKLSISISFEDMTARANAKQYALALKELKEGCSEEANFADIKLTPRDLRKVLHKLKKAHKHRVKQRGTDKKGIWSVNLRNCGIDDGMCEMLADTILSFGRYNPDDSPHIGTLQSINLSNNDITTRGALLILGALKQNTHITNLSLAGNDIAEGVNTWLTEQITINLQAKKSPSNSRLSMRDTKKPKKSQSLDSHITVVPLQEEKANVESLRNEAEKLGAQVQALRLEMKRLEAKNHLMSKKKASSIKEKEREDTDDKIFDSGVFHLVDASQVKIGRRIAAAGGSGASIYEATVDGWTCALKEINDVKFMNNATIASFEREIKIIASLPSHPNVCRYLFASRKDNTIRLFMSLYHGTLASTIKAKQALVHRASSEVLVRTSSSSSLSRLLSVLSPSQGSLSHTDLSGSDCSWSSTGSEGADVPEIRDKVSTPRVLLSPRDKAASSKSLRSSQPLRAASTSNTDHFYFQPKQVHFFATEIIAGIEFLHFNGIIHRDVKCENIFSTLDMEGNIKSLAIGDFDTALNTFTNRPTTVCGTTAFMAPEVFRGHDYSQKADVFSYGVVLYRLLTFELPWGRGMSVLNYEERTARPIEFPLRLLHDPSFYPLTELCQRCLLGDPHERPTSKEVKEALLTMNV